MRRLIFALVMAIPLASCAASVVTSPSVDPAKKTGEAQPFITQPPSPSATLYEPTSKTISVTPRLSLTPKPPRPSATPTLTPTTFNPSQIVTQTPDVPAACPPATANTAPDLSFFDFNYEKPDNLDRAETNILAFLNQYGPAKLVAELQRRGARPGRDFAYADWTNDQVAEFALGAVDFYVFGCRDGQYVTLLKLMRDGYGWPASITDVADGNADRVPEIIFKVASLSQGGGLYEVYEWTAEGFKNRLAGMDPQYPYYGEIYVTAGSTVAFGPVGNDGLRQIVADLGIPAWGIYAEGLPWRTAREYYTWNGIRYAIANTIYSAPEYRFQAVQDADRFALKGQYEQALAMYQSAVFSDTLGWWSPDRAQYLRDIYFPIESGQPTIVPPPTNSDEYYQLSAYARFRIATLHLVRGWVSDAETVYVNLIDKYPLGNAGYPYAEMATAFWNEYQITGDIGSACRQAMQYASDHPDSLVPLGSYYHGEQSWRYQPEDVCPFK